MYFNNDGEPSRLLFVLHISCVSGCLHFSFPVWSSLGMWRNGAASLINSRWNPTSPELPWEERRLC